MVAGLRNKILDYSPNLWKDSGSCIDAHLLAIIVKRNVVRSWIGVTKLLA